MTTAPFGAVLETALKQPAQGGKLRICSGVTISPEFFCCVSGSAVGVAKDPVAHLVLSATRVCMDDPVTATYSGSWSPSSTINSWEVDWGDGNYSTGGWPGAGSVTHPAGGYAIPATYTVTLTVTDLLGAQGKQSISVEVLDCTFTPIELLGGCGASGPWQTDTGGINWDNIGGGVLDGVRITDIKVTPFSAGREIIKLWAATENGLYRGTYNLETNGATWTRINPTPPAGYTSVPNIVSVCPSKFIEREIYFLAHDNTNDIVWVYFSYDDGETWDYVTIGNIEWTDLDGGLLETAETLSPGPLDQMYVGGWCWFPTGTWLFNRWGYWSETMWDAVSDGV